MSTQNDVTGSGQEQRTPEQIEADIEQTKSAIAGELRELGEKLSPDQLREGARHIIQDAKEEAKEVIREAKDAAAESVRSAKEAAVDSMRTAKEHAMESVNHTLEEVGTRARQVTSVATGFVSANAVPLALLGVGAGWLFYSLRKQREADARFADDRYAGRRGSYEAGFYDDDAGYAEYAVGRARGGARNLAARARAESGHLVERARAGAHQVSDRAIDLTHRASDQLDRTQQRTLEFAHDNPLAVSALAVAVGVGIGLMLPSSRAENQLMGPTRDRVARDVKESAMQAKRIVQSTAEDAAAATKGTLDEIKQSLTQPNTWR